MAYANDNVNRNFICLLRTITILVTEYFNVIERLFSNTIFILFDVINSQVTMYFKIFNNLFIASLDTVRYLVNEHFVLVEKLMVTNKSENILILSITVIILHWNYQYYHQHFDLHFHHQHHCLNQTDSIPVGQNSLFPYSHHQ